MNELLTSFLAALFLFISVFIFVGGIVGLVELSRWLERKKIRTSFKVLIYLAVSFLGVWGLFYIMVLLPSKGL